MSGSKDHEILAIAETLLDLPESERIARLQHLDLRPDIEEGVRRVLRCAERDDALGDERIGELGEALLSEETRGAPRTDEAESDGVDRGRARPIRIGRYRIVREIGHGGMGVVYLAEQESPRRSVALKLVLPHLATPELRSRLQREAEILGQLQHPGIACVYEAVVDDDREQPFFAMEYIEGETLDTFASRHELDKPDRLRLVASICDAVQHAHMKGVLHRDLKPSNILVTQFECDDSPRSAQHGAESRSKPRRASAATGSLPGQPKILDFGIARLTDSDVNADTLQTRTDQVVGTLAYMSPEQFSGNPRALDTRCDVYSLGVILFELLTGELPREVSGLGIARVAHVVQNSEAPSADSVDVRLRGDIATIIAKALQKERDRRYPSAAELAEDIRRHLDNEPIRARPNSTFYQLTKYIRRHRAVATTAAIGILLTVALTIWALVNAKHARDHARIADERARIVTERQEELSRLSDQRELRLLEERMVELWPPTPGLISTLDDWILDAEQLVARLAEHEATSARLAPIAIAASSRDESQRSDEDKRTLWWYETLERLIEDLRRLLGADDKERTIAAIRARRDVARKVAAVTSGPTAEAGWQRIREEIRELPIYEGLDLPPQVGLVPLGPDPESGLHEFWHVQTGDRPRRDPSTGRWVMTGDTGIVLVLLPRADFLMGSTGEPGRPNYTPQPYTNESPPVALVLDAFFCSKYEVTQGQWGRVTGGRLEPGLRGRISDEYRKYPVCLVAWEEAVEANRRMGLRLPSEAQWEYACRAGTDTTWHSGTKRETLRDVANLADRALSRITDTNLGAEAWDDDWPGTSPVGIFAPNAFGLHDMHGNVFEWTRDQYQPTYQGYSFDPIDGRRGIDPALSSARVARGGSYAAPAPFARSAVRARYPIDHSDDGLGYRPVRPIERP